MASKKTKFSQCIEFCGKNKNLDKMRNNCKI